MLLVTLNEPTRSGSCLLLPVELRDVALALRSSGMPLKAANTPLICQSSASAPRIPPYPWLLCHGSWYTNPNWRLCRRSKPAGPQLRQSSLGVFHAKSALPSPSPFDESFIALLKVYAPLMRRPCVNG